MEYRIKDYSISGNSITLPRKTGIEDIRLIYNETQKILICSTAKKDNLSAIDAFVVNQLIGTTTINVPTSICVLMPMDNLTIKCDYGDDLSSVESKVEEVGNKIDNIKLPEIDTTELASKDLERFFGLPAALPEYEPMTEEELITQAEDIWNTIFNE